MSLNDDVVRLICDLLPREALMNAAEAHPVFFDRYIKERYRRVELTRASGESKRLWTHVQENGYVARAVKCLHISPWAVKPQMQSHHSRTDNALNTVAMLLDREYATKQVKKKFTKAVKEELQHTKALFSTLRDIQDYHIDWDGDPTYPPELFTAFLQPLYSWRDTLTSLSLHIPVDMLNSFVTAKLPHLRHVHICLSSGKMSHEKIDLHLDGFLVFLHNLKDTLNSISIRTSPSSEHLELSRFFSYLGFFPHLRRISLVIPFDGAQLPDPQPFCRFVHKHERTLEALVLRTTRCAPHAERVAPECFNWIQAVISSIHKPFPELRDVTLALRPLKASLELLMDFLGLHAFTLESLVLTDRTLSYGDVCNYVLPALISHHSGVSPLRTLGMRVNALQPVLLRIIARDLPRLKVLKLDLADRSQMDRLLVRSYNALALFDEALSSDSGLVGTWDLEELEISPGANVHDTTVWAESLKSLFETRIPSLQSVRPLVIEEYL